MHARPRGHAWRNAEFGRPVSSSPHVFGGIPQARKVLEAGPHSPWISRLLSGIGHDVVVANSRRVQLIAQGDRKADRNDARQLAQLGRN